MTAESIDINKEPMSRRIKRLSDLKLLFCKYLSNYTIDDREFCENDTKFIFDGNEYVVTHVFYFKQKDDLKSELYCIIAKKNPHKKRGFNYYIVQ